MIDFVAGNAGAFSFIAAFLAVGGYAWRYWTLGGKDLHREINDMAISGMAASALPVNLFLMWMATKPSLIPKMSAAFEQFSVQLFVYGLVSLFVIANSLWQRWPRKAKD